MTTFALRIDSKGRASLPRGLRELLHIQPGDELAARVEDGVLIVESRESVQERMWAKALTMLPATADDLMSGPAEDAILDRRAKATARTSKRQGESVLAELGIE